MLYDRMSLNTRFVQINMSLTCSHVLSVSGKETDNSALFDSSRSRGALQNMQLLEQIF